MATYTEISLRDLQALAVAHGIPDVDGVEGISAGSVNSNYWAHTSTGSSFFFRIYEEQNAEGATEEWRLLAFLGEHGVPVPQVVRPEGSVAPLMYKQKPVAFFERMHGNELCYSLTTQAHLVQVGSFLGRLHNLGMSYEKPKVGRFEPSDLLERVAVARKAGRLELAPDLDLVEAKIRSQVDLSQGAELPQTVIHGDLFRDNIRFVDDEISGVLDWESASAGFPGYDLSVVLLAWCYGESFDRDRMRALLDSYQRVRKLTKHEIETLHGMTCQAALRFTITRITDFYLRTDQSGAVVPRDYRRFLARFKKLEDMGPTGFLAQLDLRA